MKDLTKEQINALKQKLIMFKTNFEQNNDINSTRDRALMVLGRFFGDKSPEYENFGNIGFYSWSKGGYTDDDRLSFIDCLDGILDSLDILGA